MSPSFNGPVAGASDTVKPEIHLKMDVSEWFKSPTTINFAILNTVHMAGTDVKTKADSNADAFSVEHIHN